MNSLTFWWLMFLTVVSLTAPFSDLMSKAISVAAGIGVLICMGIATWRQFKDNGL